MVLGRAKGWVVPESEKAKRSIWLASPEGLAFRARLSKQMKARWVAQKAKFKVEVL